MSLANYRALRVLVNLSFPVFLVVVDTLSMSGS